MATRPEPSLCNERPFSCERPARKPHARPTHADRAVSHPRVSATRGTTTVEAVLDLRGRLDDSEEMLPRVRPTRNVRVGRSQAYGDDEPATRRTATNTDRLASCFRLKSAMSSYSILAEPTTDSPDLGQSGAEAGWRQRLPALNQIAAPRDSATRKRIDQPWAATHRPFPRGRAGSRCGGRARPAWKATAVPAPPHHAPWPALRAG